MFNSLKEKFFNVQEEITTSFRNLKLDRQASKDASKRRKAEKDVCNYDAGLEILERYQSYWADIHSKTEITALCAVEVDEIIISLHSNYEEQWKKVGQLSNCLALIPQLVHGVQEVCDLILNVQCSFDETEEALLMLEDMIETQELREKQLDHRFQLALYQEKRASELEDLKEKLTEEHLRKIEEYEKKREAQLKERQAAFQEAFEEDLHEFKAKGAIPKLGVTITTASTPSLEEILLEDDPQDLESFLADQNSTEEIDGATDIPIEKTSNSNDSPLDPDK